MNKKIIHTACIWIAGFFFISLSASCSFPPSYSNQVIVAMSEPGHSSPPVAHYKGTENAICRAGVPEDHYLPWDENRDSTSSESTVPEDKIYLSSVADYWFKVTPSIHNTTIYYLVITDIFFRSSPRNETTGTPTTFSSYCSTSPLYILAPKKTVSFSDVGLTYNPGNIIFYVDGLPSGLDGDAENDIEKINPSPVYSVSWKMVGYFATDVGKRAGSFQKIGRFNTLIENF